MTAQTTGERVVGYIVVELDPFQPQHGGAPLITKASAADGVPLTREQAQHKAAKQKAKHGGADYVVGRVMIDE